MSLTTESVVVITGAASGIGRALAIRLAHEPIAGIAIADVDQEGLVETVQLIGDARPRITTHQVNVADEEQMRMFVLDVVVQHKVVTHIINNAGVALGGLVTEVSLDDMRWLININFWGTVYGTKFFLPILQKQKNAHIINFSSIFGIIAPPGNATYAASKFAVRGFTEALRHELENTSISVSVVHPGGVKTNIANRAKIGSGVTLTEEERQKKIEDFNKLLAITAPEQAAETIVKGIKKRYSHIIVGADARLLSLFARLFPRRCFSIINFISGGKLRNT